MFLVRRWRGNEAERSSYNPGGFPWRGTITMFGLGVAIAVITILIRVGEESRRFMLEHPDVLATVGLSGGINTAIVYWIIRPFLRWFGFGSLPVFLVVVGVGKVIIGTMIGALWPGRPNLNQFSFVTSSEFWTSLFTSPDSLARWIPGALITVLAAAWLTRRDRQLADETAMSSVAFGGVEMNPSRSHATRLLCATALTSVSFRALLTRRFREHYRAATPELGVDLGLVARVWRYAESREVKYALIYVGLGFLIVVGGVVASAFGAIIAVLVAAGVQWSKSYITRYRLCHLFARDIFDPQKVSDRCGGELPADVTEALPSPDQNLIVYKGFTPFIGAGINLGGWSFAVSVAKVKDSAAPGSGAQAFQTTDLYTAVEDALRSLDIPGMAISHLYFVSGTDIRNDRLILPREYARPGQRLANDELANRLLGSADHRVRHYTTIRIHDWGNELVLSYFMRASQLGPNLFVEVNRFLLTPLADGYRKVDTIPPATLGAVAGMGLVSLIQAPFLPLYGLAYLYVRIVSAIAHALGLEQRRQKREIRQNPLYNYGADNSIRQQAMSENFGHYFQKLDGDFYIKMLEREILDVLVRFLDEHNIDTSDIRERQTTIMNTGVIVHGDVKAQSLAVGAGAQASTNVKSGRHKLPKIAKGAGA